MKISETSFTVFDFETTGLYPYSGDRICEIGAVRVTAGRRGSKKFHTLINPERSISPGAFAVNRITEEMVRDKPTIDEVMPKFLRFIEGSVLVAYNAGFDLGFLECALAGQGNDLDGYYIIDALRLARRIFPEIGRYNLGNVAGSLGISTYSKHRALADAIITLKIFKRELGLLSAEGIERVESIATQFKCSPRLSGPVYGDKLTVIEEAIRSGVKLSIVYRSSWSGAISRRTITPKKIQRGYDRSYVVAVCHIRNEERNFRLDCIEEVRAL